MIKKLILLAVFLIFIFSPTYSQTFSWYYPYSLYRLVYQFNLSANATDVYVNISIPTNIIDTVISKCQLVGDSSCPSAYPIITLGYSNGTQVAIPRYQQTYLVSYNGFPQVIRAYLGNLTAGTYYLLVYYPYVFVETFEECIVGNNTCPNIVFYQYSDLGGYGQISVISSDIGLSKGNAIKFSANAGGGKVYSAIFMKNVAIPFNPNYPYYIYYTGGNIYYHGGYIKIYISFTKKDGTKFTLGFGDCDFYNSYSLGGTYGPCYSAPSIPIGTFFEITRYLWNAGVYAQDIANITAIGVGFGVYPYYIADFAFDDLMLISYYG